MSQLVLKKSVFKFSNEPCCEEELFKLRATAKERHDFTTSRVDRCNTAYSVHVLLSLLETVQTQVHWLSVKQ